MVLFPGPGAVDIEEMDPAELLDDTRKRNLIVVDGTWRQAGRVMKDLQCLRRAVDEKRVKCVQFANGGSSAYMFRREPREYCLSTLESISYALRFLEPQETGLMVDKYLTDTFKLMVKLQMGHIRLVSVVRGVLAADVLRFNVPV